MVAVEQIFKVMLEARVKMPDRSSFRAVSRLTAVLIERNSRGKKTMDQRQNCGSVSRYDVSLSWPFV
jgi:hypothetical protein